MFATVGLGMCMVDAFFAYRMEFRVMNYEVEQEMDFIIFASKVAYSLIFNSYYSSLPATRRQGQQDDIATGQEHHILRPLHTHSSFSSRERSINTRSKLRCRVCKNQTSYYCVKCSTPQKLYACCNPWPQSGDGAPKLCYFEHRIV